MKFRIGKSPLVGTIFFVALSFSISEAQTVDSLSITAADSGYLKVSFPQESLKVYLDDVFIGESPIGILKLAIGEHQLRVLNPKRASWFDRDWSQKITLATDDTVALEIEFPSYFFINSDPFNATVLANGKELGRTPLILSTEKTVRNIILKKEGYKDCVIGLADPESKLLNVALEREKGFQQQTQSRLALKRQSQVRKNLLSYSTLAFGFLSGTAAVYFRKRADDTYNKYITAENPTAMDRYFRDTERFDKLSGVFYGLFEACFLFYVYLVFRRAEE